MGVNGIYGLSGSGLDIESMVKMGMMSKQSKYEKMQQEYTKQEWTKAAYLDIYDKLYEYDHTTMAPFKNSNNMNARSAESSNSAIKTTASSSAQIGTHYITVNRTATNARLVGTKKLTSDGSINLSSVSGIDTLDSITFYIGANSDSGVTPATYASVSFSSTALSSADKAKGVLESALASKFGLDEVSSIKTSGTTVTIIGPKTTTTDSNASTTIKAYTTTSTTAALSFSIADGANSKNVDITYGDLAKLLNNDDATFQDFVDLLNQKLKTKSVNIEASYDDADGFTFTNKTASSSDTVTVSLNPSDIGIESAFMSALYDASSAKEQTDLFNQSDDGNYYLEHLNDTGGKAALYDTAKMKKIEIAASDVAASATFNTLVSAISSAGINVKGSFDAANGTFSFYNKNVGADNSIGIFAGNANAATLLNAMGLKSSEGNKDLTNVDKIPTFSANSGYSISGKNSSVLINGVKYEGTNSIQDSGITYNITNVTEKTSSVVTVDQDVDTIVKNVKSFVESYNTLLSDLYKMYNEKPNSSYAPLTDAQKAEMTEEQIKKWEEKAKAGLLYHDSNLRKIIDGMREAISDKVTSLTSSNYDSAYSIGISTNGLYGQLQLDEDKLRTALSNDADSVYNLFTKIDSTTTAAKDNASHKANGIAQRLSGGIGSVMAKAENSITSIAGTSSDTSDDSTLSTLLRNLQTRMSNFKSMMNAFEDKLYKKYDAMEAALASLGSQMNFVSGAFS